jgi:hypothetical protein
MTAILNIKKYDLVFATSFETMHGVTGHIFEMIEYCFVCRRNGINAAMALLDGTDVNLLIGLLTSKYNFNNEEVADLTANIIVFTQPKIILANNMCIVDGSPRFGSCTIYADNVFLLRCYDGELDFFSNNKTIKRTHLLQDFSMYTERYEHLDIEVVDYNKKLLWDRYYTPKSVKTNTAMFYMMNRCKARPPDEVESYMVKHSFDYYLIITDVPQRYQHLASDQVLIEQVPIINLFERFDTYIYTPVTKVDCSPRFMVECAVFGKDIIYEIEYLDPGILARQRGIDAGVDTLLLKDNDPFIEYVNRYI